MGARERKGLGKSRGQAKASSAKSVGRTRSRGWAGVKHDGLGQLGRRRDALKIRLLRYLSIPTYLFANGRAVLAVHRALSVIFGDVFGNIVRDRIGGDLRHGAAFFFHRDF
jgi:hypothetical protein